MTRNGDLVTTMLHSMKFSGAGTFSRPLVDSGYLRCGPQQQCLACFVVAAILVMLALPAGAVAKAGYEVQPGGIQLILPVEKRTNYVISVSANERQRVQFSVKGPSSAIEYSTKGRVSSRRIEATFGTLGRIDVKLHLAPYPPDPPHKGRCKGRAPLYQGGTYGGTIEFAHQGGVHKVSDERGRVYFKRRFRQVCKRQRPQSKPGGKIEAGFLEVGGKGEGHTVLLEALDFALRRNPARSGGSLAVEAYEGREGVRIARRISASINHDSFAMSRRGEIPETVEVVLPKPFAGRALYSLNPGSSPSWTGDLSVDLPGADRIPLTGPGFNAILCRSSVARLDRCL
jgi:hypothetical protein